MPELSLDDFKASLDKDAPPAEKRGTTRKINPANPPGRPTNASKQKQLQEEIEGYLVLMGMPLLLRDRHANGSSCGDLFVKQDEKTGLPDCSPEAKQLASVIAQLGMKYDVIRKFFESTDGISLWLQLGMALYPFVITPYYAHFVNAEEVTGVNPASTVA